jgi:hypothetical protein
VVLVEDKIDVEIDHSIGLLGLGYGLQWMILGVIDWMQMTRHQSGCNFGFVFMGVMDDEGE